jgi:putative hydrolase of the HAD superfamily
MKAVLFDLDNTVYPEMEFVESGFRAVARYLSTRCRFDEESLFAQMIDILQDVGRGKIFDNLLYNLGLYHEEKVNVLVYIYRSHKPTISLYEDSLPTLMHLKDHGIRLGILSDGMSSTQRNKIASLGLENIFDAIVCTDELGKEFWKPSIVPYKVALDLLEVSPSEAAYVGNDPAKDFVGANSLNMLTIQVTRDSHRDYTPNGIPESARANFIVRRLEEVLPIIEGRLDVY